MSTLSWFKFTIWNHWYKSNRIILKSESSSRLSISNTSGASSILIPYKPNYLSYPYARPEKGHKPFIHNNSLNLILFKTNMFLSLYGVSRAISLGYVFINLKPTRSNLNLGIRNYNLITIYSSFNFSKFLRIGSTAANTFSPLFRWSKINNFSSYAVSPLEPPEGFGPRKGAVGGVAPAFGHPAKLGATPGPRRGLENIPGFIISGFLFWFSLGAPVSGGPALPPKGGPMAGAPQRGASATPTAPGARGKGLFHSLLVGSGFVPGSLLNEGIVGAAAGGSAFAPAIGATSRTSWLVSGEDPLVTPPFRRGLRVNPPRGSRATFYQLFSQSRLIRPTFKSLDFSSLAPGRFEAPRPVGEGGSRRTILTNSQFISINPNIKSFFILPSSVLHAVS